jgi:hypothetical protein
MVAAIAVMEVEEEAASTRLSHGRFVKQGTAKRDISPQPCASICAANKKTSSTYRRDLFLEVG